MKKYTITSIDKNSKTKVTVFVGDEEFFTIPKDEQSEKLIPGDKIGVMYDNIIGSMPVAYIYNGRVDMGAFAPCESMGGHCYVDKIKWWDRPYFNFIAAKNIVADGKKPRVAAWQNAQILAGIIAKKRVR
ncbi:MAG: hypothetical protein J6W79_01525 [Alphaproteobacteria bacterium]|nr:hypothetical protein [Alphaproteobacteria bacterium]